MDQETLSAPERRHAAGPAALLTAQSAAGVDRWIDRFAAHGYVVVPDALTRDEVAALNQAIDEDLRLRPELWIVRSGRRKDNPCPLFGSRVFDRTMTNRRILPIVRALMRDEVCFDEILVTVRSPCRDRPATPIFHRDASHLPGHPLGLRHLSLLYYLTDHDETTHGWWFVPEDAAAARRQPQDTDGSLAAPVYGPAGTAVLFNAASCHAVVRRRTPEESRTIRIEFGHRGFPAIGNDTIVPARLLRSRSESTRRLFQRTNLITHLVRRDRR